MSASDMHFYTSGNVPQEVWGNDGICLYTVWNTGPNAPIILWGVSQSAWESLSDKGIEVSPSLFVGENARFILTHIQSSDWGIN